MDHDPIIAGPRTKSALALAERHRRRGHPRAPTHRPSPDVAPLELMMDRNGSPASSTRVFAATISEVGQRLGLTLRAIRLYEEMGLIACGRGPKNMRVLDAAAQERLQAIVDLKALGLTISEIAQMLSRQVTDPRALRGRIEARLEAIDRQRAVIAAYLSRLPQADGSVSQGVR